MCARWVSQLLYDDHKNQRMGAALMFLTHYHQDGDELSVHITTGDETWVSHKTPETKRQSMQWHQQNQRKQRKL